MKRVPGCSWIEIRSKVTVFVNGDERILRPDEIQLALESCLVSSSLDSVRSFEVSVDL